MSEARRLDFEDLWSIPVPEGAEISPDGTQVVYVLRTPDRETDGYRTSLWLAAADGSGAPVQITQGPKDSTPRWSPDGSQIAFLSVRSGGGKGSGSDKPQIHLLPVAGAGEARGLTDLPLGAGSPSWSKDGSRLAFTAGVDLQGPAADEKERERRAAAPLVIDRLGYKMDGVGLIRSLRQHLFVCGVDAESTPVQLTWGDWSCGGPVWSPDGESVIVAGSRGEDRDLEPTSQLYAVPVGGGGAPRRLTPETGFAGSPVFTSDGTRIIYTGKLEAGPGHSLLFSIPADGGEPVNIAPKFDRNVMTGSPGYPGGPLATTDDGKLLFCARDRGATHVYVLALDGNGEPQKLLGAPDNSVSGLSVSRSTGALATVLSDGQNPGEVAVLPAGTAAPTILTDLFAPSLPGLQLFVPEERTFTAPDGTEIHGWVVRDAASATPGPLLLDIHGGPHNAWGPTFDNKHHHHQVLAADGWTVLYINPRGSDGYGEDFMTAVSGAWGTSDTDDFLCAVDALIDEGIADRSQVAVTGYSYGGYMTCWLTATTDRFAAGVTGAPCSSLLSEAGSADMGLWLARHEVGALPWEDPERYELHSPQAHVHKVTAPTLILHGESDDRCPVGQAEEWFTGLRANGVPVEMVRYPGCSHLFIVDGRPSHRIDYGRRVAAWVREHVGPNAAVASRPKRRNILAAYSSRLDSLAKSLNVPGVSVALLHDGVIEEAWAGVLHAERPDKVTAATRFQIGSITKVFTTALLMQLVDEGKLDLDAPVVSCVPEFRLADAEASRAITVRQLLCHTSGIPGDWFPDLGDAATPRDYVETLGTLELAHPIGEHFDYTNASFVLAGRLVEVITGRPWAEALADRIVSPVGMDMAATGDPGNGDLVGLAMGHLPADEAQPLGAVKPAPRYATHPEFAPCGSTPIATARALVQFARLFAEDGRAPDGTEVLSPAAVKQMAERQIEVPPAGLRGRTWRGLGWGIADWDGEIALSHTGGTLGQLSSLTVLPERGVAVAILTNGPGGTLLANAVNADLFAEVAGLTPPGPPEVPHNPPTIDAARYTGLYESVGARVEVKPDGGGLTVQITDLAGLDPAAPPHVQPPISLRAVDDATFACPDGSVISFVAPDANGRYEYVFTGRLTRRKS